jgi:Uma2 family endonuclease
VKKAEEVSMQTQVTEQKQINTYYLRIPVSYQITKKLEELQHVNPEYLLAIENENLLTITESAFLFEEYGYFGIKLPGFTKEMFDELEELNEEENFEFDDKEEIFIKMAIFAFIGLITALIGASLVNWARGRKSGNVYSDPTGYELDDPERPGKKLRRIPDVSYIAYDSVSEEEQDSWDGFITCPPNLVIEIISAKRGLKGDLKKMQDIWMKNGADVGLVICPFTEQIYIFEKGVNGYSSQSIYSDFTHPMLPGYSENFGNYIKKRK